MAAVTSVSWCAVGILAHYGCRHISKLVCGGHSGALWLPSHHPGGCCTLVVVEDIPPFYVKCFEYPEKHYINVTNYYYYYSSVSFVPIFNFSFLEQTSETKSVLN